MSADASVLYAMVHPALSGMTEADRKELLDLIRQDFCIHCGREYTPPMRTCYCTRDE